jgi:ring-1,2-phenylacetyl-CoA epoxidase subunit PaaB
MSQPDTQWPRFEVFQQERPGKPHQNTGSVHAPDAEMALQNARDVFARRPECHSLWVAPADAILSKTAEELENDTSWQDGEVNPEAPAETYYVFQKTSQRRSMTYVNHAGEVEAQSPAQALQKALATFNEKPAVVWWVCPARAVYRSREEDVATMFAPADDKTFRLPNEYRTVTAMKQVRQTGEGDEEAGDGF